MIYDSDKLLDSIKTRSMIPVSQTTFSDDDLLNLANEEMESFIVGSLLRVQEEYLVYLENIPLVANQDHYRIPDRALGQRLRDIVFIDGGTIKARIPQVGREEIPDYSINPAQRPYCFYLEGNYIVLLPGPNSTSASIDVSYYGRPGKIVTSDRYGVITDFDNTAKTITLSNAVPANITVGSLIDIQTARSGNEYVLKNLTVTVIAGNIITVAEEIADENGNDLITIGDYACTAKEAAIPQCPEEMHPLLAQRVSCRVLEALNDSEGLQNASAKLLDMEKNILALVDTRVTGKPRKIVNRTGILAAARLWSIKNLR